MRTANGARWKHDILLPANRGEIAIRILRTAQELGWSAGAVYTPQGTSNATLANEAVKLDDPSWFASPERIVDITKRYPAMIKALHGGAGSGIQVVSAQEWVEAFKQCMGENQSGQFSSEEHVEAQIAGDGMGDVTQVWERACSVQRRFRKLVEMAPSTVTRSLVQLLLASTAMAYAVEHGVAIAWRGVRVDTRLCHAGVRERSVGTYFGSLLAMILVRGRDLGEATQQAVRAPRETSVGNEEGGVKTNRAVLAGRGRGLGLDGRQGAYYVTGLISSSVLQRHWHLVLGLERLDPKFQLTDTFRSRYLQSSGTLLLGLYSPVQMLSAIGLLLGPMDVNYYFDEIRLHSPPPHSLVQPISDAPSSRADIEGHNALVSGVRLEDVFNFGPPQLLRLLECRDLLLWIPKGGKTQQSRKPPSELSKNRLSGSRSCSPRATPQPPSLPPSTLENGMSAVSAGTHNISDGVFRRMVSPERSKAEVFENGRGTRITGLEAFGFASRLKRRQKGIACGGKTQDALCRILRNVRRGFQSLRISAPRMKYAIAFC
ncbi:hypothetical protein FIBSPDRAFT_895358 [Athelia psychrophila]|uniref:Biotin carboxylation domain-containing protein n=1 Tax=Athelia psychrophila TaxID=1759441 RepID=A0A166EQH3_9AGAM|nr:hypothetical protein FIBSPDRAFT_895358 [Fibularhizoctonia sp. CBS 109695]